MSDTVWHRTAIQLRDSTYTCNSPTKEHAVEFISWFLFGIHDDMNVTITYGQAKQIPPRGASKEVDITTVNPPVAP